MKNKSILTQLDLSPVLEECIGKIDPEVMQGLVYQIVGHYLQGKSTMSDDDRDALIAKEEDLALEINNLNEELTIKQERFSKRKNELLEQKKMLETNRDIHPEKYEFYFNEITKVDKEIEAMDEELTCMEKQKNEKETEKSKITNSLPDYVLLKREYNEKCNQMMNELNSYAYLYSDAELKKDEKRIQDYHISHKEIDYYWNTPVNYIQVENSIQKDISLYEELIKRKKELKEKMSDFKTSNNYELLVERIHMLNGIKDLYKKLNQTIEPRVLEKKDATKDSTSVSPASNEKETRTPEGSNENPLQEAETTTDTLNNDKEFDVEDREAIDECLESQYIETKLQPEPSQSKNDDVLDEGNAEIQDEAIDQFLNELGRTEGRKKVRRIATFAKKIPHHIINGGLAFLAGTLNLIAEVKDILSR